MTNEHWTDDAELLERYVLQRVEQDQREKLESHLNACMQCRAAVDEEMHLAAGIRRAARAELKARLRQTVTAERVIALPWIRLATAAAIVVILVGVGIYNDWFTWYGEKQYTPAFRQEEEVSESREGAKPPSVSEDEQPGKETKGADDQRAKPQALEKRVSREPARERTLEKGKHTDIAPDAIADKISGDALKKERESQDEVAGAETGLPGWSVLVEGTILPPPRETSQLIMAQTESSASEGARSHARQKAGTPELSQKIFVQQGTRSQTFILHQLPASRLKDQRGATPRTIPSLIESTEQGLKLTLYPEILYGEEELQRATIEPIGQDSIILTLGNQRIGYRIPSVWYKSLPAKQ